MEPAGFSRCTEGEHRTELVIDESGRHAQVGQHVGPSVHMLGNKIAHDIGMFRCRVCLFDQPFKECQHRAGMIERTVLATKQGIGREPSRIKPGGGVPDPQRVPAVEARRGEVPVFPAPSRMPIASRSTFTTGAGQLVVQEAVLGRLCSRGS